MNTKQVGNISELTVLTEFVKLGFSVSIPFGDKDRYDMIVDIHGRLYKIQVKTGNYKDGKIIFNSSSSHEHRHKPLQDYKGQIDYFAVYCSQLNEIYLIHIDEATNTKSYLRTTPPKNNQTKGIRLAKDYLFQAVLSNLLAS